MVPYYAATVNPSLAIANPRFPYLLMGVIRSEVLRGQFLSLEAHGIHAFGNFVARGVLESEVEVRPHDLVFLALVLALDGRFVAADDFLPLVGSAPEGGDRLPEERVVGVFLHGERRTRMLVHFLGISALA